jgi:hypothetical protein
MGELQGHESAGMEPELRNAASNFRHALLRSHRTREFIGEMESAAAQFCREARRQGHPPERMLKDAKQVISDAIDGEDAMMAERAVLSCIQHYYRVD